MNYDAMMREALSRIEELQGKLRAAEAPRRESIAIVGLGCRFPGAAGVDDYWRLLRDSVDAVTEIPRSRWDVEALYDADPDAAGKIYTRHGGFVDGIEAFDAGFFGISPREAISLDPQQRLLLECCWEAIESAGIPTDALGDTAGGVFMGIGGVDYYQRLASRPPAGIDAYMASGNAHAIASGRLSYLLGLRGPSLSVDTACSSSLVAVHLACRSLRDGESDLALAGGVSVILSPAIHVNHCRSRMLAPDGRCKAFDAAADGFIRSEGCGVVVLKRLSDAERDGDRILAIIRGSAINQDGRTSALTVPNGPAQQAVIRAALADARLDPSRVSFVEAHGTGTALGDPIEAAALGAVFAARQAPLPIGSVKANIGHAEAAAGVAGLIKVVLAMQHREIPPQLHFKQPNPRIDWPALPLRVPTTRTPWGVAGEPLVAGVSAFGFGGTNAHVVVESAMECDSEAAFTGHEAAEAQRRRVFFNDPLRLCASAARDSNPGPLLLVLSAKTATALPTLAARCRAALTDPKRTESLSASCASAALGRAHLPVRAAVVADTVAGVGEALDAVVAGRSASGVWRGEALPDIDARIAFVYPGQGALRWGTGRELYERQPAYRAAIDRCAAALRDSWTISLTDVLYGSAGAALIERTEYAQAALFATEYAMTEAWAALGVRPTAVVGHSVGEFAAACTAGVLSVEAACRLLAERGRLMQPLGGRMAAIAASEARVRELTATCSGVTVAATNGRRQTVVSGDRAQVDRVIAAAGEAGLVARALSGDVAFHSALMDPMLAAWSGVVARERFAAPQCEWVSTLTGRESESAVAPDYWVRQVRQPVQYAAAVARLWALGFRAIVEVGPSAGLATLAVEADGTGSAEGAWVTGLRHGRPELDAWRDGVAQLYVAGARIDWRGWYGPRRSPVALPTYPFERTRYWIEAPTPEVPAGETVSAGPQAAPELRVTAVERTDYTVRWDVLASDAPASSIAPAGTWVVCGGRPETIEAVATVLQRHGASVAPALAGVANVVGVLHVGALDLVSPADGTPASSVDEEVVSSGMAVVETLRAAVAHASSARVWVVTRGAVSVNAADPPAVSQAPIWGIGKVAALEHPETWGGLIDLDPRSGDFTGLEYLLTGGVEDQLAVRDGQMHVPRLQPSRAPRRDGTLVRGDATYLITGGLGALGLEVAERLIDAGAKHLLLVSRREAEDAVRVRLDRFHARGADVRTERADVSSPDAMTRLFDRAAAEMPPLRGVVHAAGANGSQALTDLDAATLKSVVSAKVSGAWLLHERTRVLPLDFFVMFSSIASVWGSKGQAHYAAANAFLDALAADRVAHGLPGLSINWGAWAAGGMATDEAQRWLGKVGINALTRESALDAFEAWLAASGQAIVADIDWPRFLEVYQARRAHPFFQGIATKATEIVSPSGEMNRLSSLRAQAPADAKRAVTQLVRDHVVQVLNLDPRNAPAPHQGFFTIGFDSLLALELKNRLTTDLGVPLPSTLAFDYPTIRDLSEYLANDVVTIASQSAGRLRESRPTNPEAGPTNPASGMALEASVVGGGPADIDASIQATLARLERLTGKR